MTSSVSVVLVCIIAGVFADSEPQREYKLFEQADQNLDGTLTRAELDVIFLKFDKNHDKAITQSEFEDDWTNIFQLGAPVEAIALFRKADTNDDGTINSKDLPNIYSFFDMNDNGLVDLNEFLTQWGELKRAPVDSIVININGTTADPNTAAPTTGGTTH